MVLSAEQVRVLGALIEKEIVTPEAYPLSLNALINACNQKSSREPVMELDEDAVRQALRALEDLALVSPVRDARVAKYEHRARTVLNLRRDETALLCLLMLRGPQTPGELRARADRLYSFDDLEAVEATLNRLASRTAEPASGPASDALALLLPREPGAREARWAHLLSGAPQRLPSERISEPANLSRGLADRVAALESEVLALRSALAALEEQLGRSNQSPP